MSALVWDEIGSRFFETGVKKTVLYPLANGVYSTGCAWNGVTAINEASDGAETTALYADNIKLAVRIGKGTLVYVNYRNVVLLARKLLRHCGADLAHSDNNNIQKISPPLTESKVLVL